MGLFALVLAACDTTGASSGTAPNAANEPAPMHPESVQACEDYLDAERKCHGQDSPYVTGARNGMKAMYTRRADLEEHCKRMLALHECKK